MKAIIISLHSKAVMLNSDLRMTPPRQIKLFVAFPWVETSTGPGGFMICVFIRPGLDDDRAH